MRALALSALLSGCVATQGPKPAAMFADAAAFSVASCVGLDGHARGDAQQMAVGVAVAVALWASWWVR